MAKKKTSVQSTTNGNGQMGSDEKTDYSRWRLLDDAGRHTWHYLETDEELEKWPQSIADKYHLGLPTVCIFCFSPNVLDVHILIQCLRDYRIYLPRKLHFNPPPIACRSSPTFNCLRVIGHANMEGRCFCSRA